MKGITILQQLTMICMVITIVIEGLKGFFYDERYSGNSKEKAITLSLYNNRVSLSVGSYYIGSSLLSSFLMPNYIHISRCTLKEPVLLFAKADWNGLQLSVLKGMISTLSECHKMDETKKIFIPRNQCFYVENLRIDVC